MRKDGPEHQINEIMARQLLVEGTTMSWRFFTASSISVKGAMKEITADILDEVGARSKQYKDMLPRPILFAIREDELILIWRPVWHPNWEIYRHAGKSWSVISRTTRNAEGELERAAIKKRKAELKKRKAELKKEEEKGMQ